MNGRALAAILLAAGLVSTSAWSVEPEEPARSSEQERSIDSQSGRHFETKKRERLIQMLRLDDATRAKLQERWEQLDSKSQNLRRERREAFSALREQIKAPELRSGPRSVAGDTDLKKALERVYAVEDAMMGLRRERLQIARDLLTPEQQGRFLMFNMKLHKEMLKRLEREQSGGKEK